METNSAAHALDAVAKITATKEKVKPLPVLKNPRHERMALLLAQGLSAIDAYEQAGYKRHDSNSSIWARKAEISGRVSEILGKASESTQTTVESLMADSKRVQQGAEEAGQWSAAIAAIRERGILSGKRVERSERGQPGEFDAIEGMDAEELQRYLASPDLDDEHEGSVH